MIFMARMFGTDGVRGVVNEELTCEIAYKLGQAAVVFLGSQIVVGKDTRISGDMLEAAVCAGIMSVGGTALTTGVLPTPGIAFLVRELHCDGGIVISASHNPPQYNGIKFFDAEGYKLPDAVEDQIEDFYKQGGLEAGSYDGFHLAAGDAVGITVPIENACELYIDHAVQSVLDQGVDFEGMHVAIDAGHGASSYTSPTAFEKLGAHVTVINDDYSGTDINVDCGSTNLGALESLMGECGADIGVAHDGDADRVILMTPDGDVLDGDYIAATLAIDMNERGVLPGNTVVSTVMCNLGFTHAMREHGIKVVQTKVGDRYVLEEMRASGYAIGGEQSGHMILLDYNSTGDGLVTATQYLAALTRSQEGIAGAARVMTRFPQMLINVHVENKHSLTSNGAVQAAVQKAETDLGDEGRVLIRASGTEPVVRVMVEASDEERARNVAEAIARVVEEELS